MTHTPIGTHRHDMHRHDMHIAKTCVCALRVDEGRGWSTKGSGAPTAEVHAPGATQWATTELADSLVECALQVSQMSRDVFTKQLLCKQERIINNQARDHPSNWEVTSRIMSINLKHSWRFLI